MTDRHISTCQVQLPNSLKDIVNSQDDLCFEENWIQEETKLVSPTAFTEIVVCRVFAAAKVNIDAAIAIAIPSAVSVAEVAPVQDAEREAGQSQPAEVCTPVKRLPSSLGSVASPMTGAKRTPPGSGGRQASIPPEDK